MKECYKVLTEDEDGRLYSAWFGDKYYTLDRNYRWAREMMLKYSTTDINIAPKGRPMFVFDSLLSAQKFLATRGNVIYRCESPRLMKVRSPIVSFNFDKFFRLYGKILQKESIWKAFKVYGGWGLKEAPKGTLVCSRLNLIEKVYERI